MAICFIYLLQYLNFISFMHIIFNRSSAFCTVCAAPGSKTFQLLEIIHQSSKPGGLPDGLVCSLLFCTLLHKFLCRSLLFFFCLQGSRVLATFFHLFGCLSLEFVLCYFLVLPDSLCKIDSIAILIR